MCIDHHTINALRTLAYQCADDDYTSAGVEPATLLALLDAFEERAALAAYADDFCSAAYLASEVMDDFNADQCEARNRLDHFRFNSPESVKKSLARRDDLKQADGIKKAAAFIEKKADDYDAENGSTDPSTGHREYPGDGAEYYNELMDLADELRKEAEGHQ